MIPDKPISGEKQTGDKSPTRVIGAIIDALAVLEKIEGASPVVIERGANGIVIRLDAPSAASIEVARVTEKIPAKGQGKAKIKTWNADDKKFEVPADAEDVVVYDVLENFGGLGPAELDADVFVVSFAGGYMLLNLTCPKTNT